MKYTPLHRAPPLALTWPISVHGFSALPSILAIVMVISAAFLTGSYTLSPWETQLYSYPSIANPIPLDTYTNTFRYNYTFASTPSDDSIAAWKSIFPRRGGYFSHPQISPQRAAFSVFHQLHCLNGIRQGYWMLHSAVIQGKKLEEDEIPFMASPTHIRHCVDLLRQSLQCRPDLTVEVKDKARGGVTGFGTAHQCRDWSQLLAWLEKWETYDEAL